MKESSRRLEKLPRYLFDEIYSLKEAYIRKGRDIIDLGEGNPDLKPDAGIVDAFKHALDDPENYRYPSFRGNTTLREAFSAWMRRRFGVSLDPEREILVVAGTKEGIAHLPVGLIDPEDIVIVPDPCYPVYSSCVELAGAECFKLMLREDNDFLPVLDEIPEQTLRRAKMMLLNYPNNPTTAGGSLEFFKKVVDFAIRNEVLICHDAAYSEVYSGEPPPSILQIDGAKSVSIEFHSISKTFSLAGFRLGFACGCHKLLEALLKVKTTIDSGIFMAIQVAAEYAFKKATGFIDTMRETYRSRKMLMVEQMKSMGLNPYPSDYTFYIWVRVPEGFKSKEFSNYLLEKAGILSLPGTGFGSTGEGYIRLSLTTSEERLKEAIRRLKSISLERR